MGLIQTADGEWVRVPDNMPEARVRELTGGASGDAAPTKGEPGVPDRVRRRADAYEKTLAPGTTMDTLRGYSKGMLGSFSDEVGGGAAALANLAGNLFGLGDGRGFGETYTEQRDVQRELDRRAQQRSPIANTVGEVGGAVMMPVGTGAGALKLASKATGSTGLAKAAAAITNAGPVSKAVLIGANQGAINGAGAAANMENVPDAMGTGALVGAGVGGALGTAVKFGSGVAHAVTNRNVANAGRVAATKAGERIRQGKMTPAQAEAEIAAARADGNDTRFMDLTTGTRSDAAYYSRRPALDVSGDLKDLSTARLDARGERFTGKIDEVANPTGAPTDSDELIKKVVEARKAQGKKDYAVGGVLDAPVNWSDDLDKFWAEAPADTRKTMLRAREEITGRRGDPDAYITPNSSGGFTIVPSFRTFDYLKRGFDAEIGSAKAAGDMAKVQRLQSELSSFKDKFADANRTTEYADLLLRQRSGFEKEQAAQEGQRVLQAIGGGRQQAREVMKRIDGLKDHEREAFRTSILDGLLGMDAKANPLGMFRAYTRNAKQREVMEFAFGGKANLENFNKYLSREIKSAETDKLVSGPNSVTSAVHMAADEADPAVGNAFNQVLRGYLLGGPLGAVSNTFRQAGMLAHGMGKHAQEAYGGLLASDGAGLAAKVDEAQAFNAARDARTTRRAVRAAKGGQQPYTDQLGNK